MIGKKCLKSLLVFGGIFRSMSVFAFGKTALADEVPVIKGDDGKYDISCIVQAPEGSKWITHYFGKVPFVITSADEKNPKASVENVSVPDAESMEGGGAKFDSVKRMWTANFSTRISFEKFVVDEGNGPVIKGVTAEESGLKRSELSFVNDIFPEATLSIRQEVSGDLADKTKSFEYVVMIEKPAFSGGKYAESAVLRKGADEKRVSYGKDHEFSVKAGEGVTLYCPVGAHMYVQRKCEKDGYVLKRSAYTDFVGGYHGERVGKYVFSLLGDSDDGASPNKVLVASGNVGMTVTDVATSDVPLTGLFLDEKSGVMMVAIALGSLVALGAGAVVYKKKMSDR